MDIESISDMVDSGVELGLEQRDFLINEIFRTKLKDDDPKYDAWNMEWLEKMSDEELLDKYQESA